VQAERALLAGVLRGVPMPEPITLEVFTDYV
jgi:hypothetical protein